MYYRSPGEARSCEKSRAIADSTIAGALRLAIVGKRAEYIGVLGEDQGMMSSKASAIR